MSTLFRVIFISRSRLGSIVFRIISQCQHNYSDVGNYDRVVIQEILKEIAQTQNVDLSAKQRFKGDTFAPPAC